MKTQIQNIALAMIVLSGCGAAQTSTSSETASRRRALHAEMTVNQIDPGLHVSKSYGTSVAVDTENKIITLSISTCPPNAMCIWGGPSYTAELVSKETESCGVIVYRAITDARPVDGALTEIIVKDNSKSICDIVYPYLTEVELNTAMYDRINGKEVKTHSTFKGKLLQ